LKKKHNISSTDRFICKISDKNWWITAKSTFPLSCFFYVYNPQW